MYVVLFIILYGYLLTIYHAKNMVVRQEQHTKKKELLCNELPRRLFRLAFNLQMCEINILELWYLKPCRSFGHY